jgi:MFS family permease
MAEGDNRIRRFYLYRAVTSFAMWGPFWTLWANSNIDDIFLITVIDMAFWITMIVFQIPTGLLGDRYGRKIVLFLGELLFAVGLLGFGLSTTFDQYLISNVIWALGVCFVVSGDTPFVYDTLVELKREKEFTKIMGYSNAVMFSVNALAYMVGGYVAYSLDRLDITLIVSAGIMTVGLSTILLLKEPKVERTQFESYVTQFKEGFRHVVRTKTILILIMFQILIQVAVYVMAVFRAIYMGESLGFDYFQIGLFYASFSIVGAFIVREASRFESYAGEKKALVFMYVAMFASLVVVFMVRSIEAIVVQYLIYAVADLQSPIVGGYINKRVDSAHRSTIAAISSVMFTGILVTVEVSAGFVAEAWSIEGSLIMIALGSLPIAFLLLTSWGRLVDAEKAATKKVRVLKEL